MDLNPAKKRGLFFTLDIKHMFGYNTYVCKS